MKMSDAIRAAECTPKNTPSFQYFFSSPVFTLLQRPITGKLTAMPSPKPFSEKGNETYGVT